MNRILGKFLVLLFLLSPMMAWSAAEIKVSTDRNPVHLDETFELVFEAEGSIDEEPDFSPLNVLLDVLRQSQSNNVSIINGDMTRTKRWVLTVMPKVLGDIQIPTIHFGKDKSQPLLIKVVERSQQVQNNASFFVNLEVDKLESVQQSQIVVTIRLFSDKSLNDYNIPALQFNHGDVLVELLNEDATYQTQIQGKPYLVVERKIALFPQKDGPLIINSFLADGSVRSNQRSFFSNFSSIPVRARSHELVLNITKKPNAKSVWLPAKSLELTDQWLSDPSKFIVGEPITRVLTIKASGLTAAQLPELKIKKIDAVKMYPDENVLKNQIDANGIVGIRQEKIAYIPSKPGIITLPKMSIEWWNTDSNEWAVTEIPEQLITVKASDQVIDKPPVTTQSVQSPIITETNPVQDNDQLESNANLERDSFWMWVSLFFAIAWLVTLVLFIRKKPQQQIETIEPIINKESITFSPKALKTACQNKDSSACKKEIINWANSEFDDLEVTQLGELKSHVNAEIYQHIMQLEAVLYSPNERNDWHPDELYKAIISWKKSANINKKEKNLQSMHLT